MIRGVERVFLALFAAFLGAALAFVSTALVGGAVGYAPGPQIVYFCITAPVLAVAGFYGTWRATRG